MIIVIVNFRAIIVALNLTLLILNVGTPVKLLNTPIDSKSVIFIKKGAHLGCK